MPAAGSTTTEEDPALAKCGDPNPGAPAETLSLAHASNGVHRQHDVTVKAEQTASKDAASPSEHSEPGPEKDKLLPRKDDGSSLKAVSFLALYRIAGPADWACLAIGCVGAAVRGVCLPLFTLLVSLIVDAAGRSLTTQDIITGVNQVRRNESGEGCFSWPSNYHTNM